MSKIMLTTTEEEEEEEESKPLLLRGERATTTTTRRNHPKAFFALLFLVVVVSSALFAVHFSSSSLSSSDRHRLGVGIPHGEEETTKLGEVNDVSTDAKGTHRCLNQVARQDTTTEISKQKYLIHARSSLFGHLNCCIRQML